jgi:hypothetical protein
MLGRFLEIALVTADTGGTWQQLQKLGFEPASTGDIWPHAYGVVACEGLAIGLHAKGDEPFSVVFVRPEVAALHRELTALGIEVESARLGSDVFNELWLRDPEGTALRVIEARSFSPPALLPARTAAGSFRWLSLPCQDIDAGLRFWSSLGAQCTPIEQPFAGFTIGQSSLACHERRVSAGPLLVFDAPADNARELLEGAGFATRPRLAALADAPHRVARGPEGLTLLMLEAAGAD